LDPSFVIAKVLIVVQSLALAPPCLISRGELDREGSTPVVGNSRAGDVCRLTGGKDSVYRDDGFSLVEPKSELSGYNRDTSGCRIVPVLFLTESSPLSPPHSPFCAGTSFSPTPLCLLFLFSFSLDSPQIASQLLILDITEDISPRACGQFGFQQLNCSWVAIRR
jgi:hypothetical protein